MRQQAEKKRKKKTDRKSNGSRQKNKREHSKMESNDSPEIPDRVETSGIPVLPSRYQENENNEQYSIQGEQD